jgi:hypothetical protein
MAAIGFEIEQVVHDVGGRGGKREADQCAESDEEFFRAQRVRAQKRNEDEQVLGPLVPAHRLHGGPQGRLALEERLSGADVAGLEPEAQSEGGIGDHGLGSLRQ